MSYPVKTRKRNRVYRSLNRQKRKIPKTGKPIRRRKRTQRVYKGGSRRAAAAFGCATTQQVEEAEAERSAAQRWYSKPGRNSHKPSRNSHKPSRNSQKPSRNSNKPSRNSHKPSRNSNKPSRNSHKPSRGMRPHMRVPRKLIRNLNLNL